MSRSKIWDYLPSPLWDAFGVFASASNLLFKQRHARTFFRKGELTGTPWLSYPAIEFLKTFDFTNKTVLEYGGGNSTIFFLNEGATVKTYEENSEWAQRIESFAKARPGWSERLAIWNSGEVADFFSFEDDAHDADLILLDGAVELRKEYARRLRHSTVRGVSLIVLDDSNWCPQASETLDSLTDFVRVDLAGFSPGVDYVKQTSFWLNRNGTIPKLPPRTPVGGVFEDWENRQ